MSAAASAVGFTYAISGLLPSLNVNSVQERRVVVEKIVLEVMPNEFTDQILIQLQTGTFFGTGDSSMPFKLASSINPTIYTLDFLKLGRVIPSILRTVNLNDTSSFLRIQTYTDSDTAIEVTGRITTYCRVMPQNSLTNPILGGLDILTPAAIITKPQLPSPEDTTQENKPSPSA